MKHKGFLFLIGLFFAVLATAQPGWIPGREKPLPEKPNRLVNDWADILQAGDEEQLERKLVAESDSTSVQIAILTILELNDYDIAQLSFRIGDDWGIGGPNQDNGLLILVSKKEREIFIATGKGMEGVVPDVTAKRIIENVILPAFREGNYYAGLDQGTDVIIKLASGEFTDELVDRPSGPPAFTLIVVVIIVLIILFLIGRGRGGGGGYINRGGWHPSPWFGSSGGGFGGGSFGGGGFGGFGGGSFGGGGAGGRW